MRAAPVLALVATLACVPEDPTSDVPPDFDGADEIDVHQHKCGGSPLDEDAPAAAVSAASIEDGVVSGAADDVGFRCSQDVCGYALTEDDEAKVLLQPCEMHPTEVARCDCLYDFDFDVDLHGADASALAVWKRSDEYTGEHTKPEKVGGRSVADD